MRAYSGVSLHIRSEICPAAPTFSHPEFDMESRIVQAQLGNLVLASVYVAERRQDYPAKVALHGKSHRLGAAPACRRPRARACGDINIARTEMDVHPRERKPVIGQLPEERALFERMLGEHLVDVGRAMAPDNPNLFTWWAPWRNMRQRNIGWRLDYVLASRSIAARATECRVLADVGTSDHAPVMMSIT